MIRVRRLGSASGAAALMVATVATTVVLIAAPASAQLEGVNLPLPEGPVPGGVVSDPGGTVKDVGGTVGGVVDDVVETGGGTVGEVGSGASKTVKDAGDKVGNAVGGDVGNTVKETTGSVSSGIDETASSVGNALSGSGKAVKEGGESVVGSQKGGFKGGGEPSVESPILGGKPMLGVGADGALAGGGAGSLAGFGPGSNAAFAAANSIEGLDLELLGERVAGTGDVRAPVELSEFAREALEAARQFAFPLALTVLIVAYMVVQGRIDRRDPKLAEATVDPDQDLLSFS